MDREIINPVGNNRETVKIKSLVRLYLIYTVIIFYIGIAIILVGLFVAITIHGIQGVWQRTKNVDLMTILIGAIIIGGTLVITFYLMATKKKKKME